jgi:CheY-like chemotaxis protein
VTRSGESAIEVARKVQPLLILLDVVMPGIDGYETCRRLKADPNTREAAVIFLSSLDETKDKVRGLEVGAVDFVSKPFQRDEVIARVNTHLTVQRLRRQLEARNAELTRELAVAQELLTDARRRVEGPLLGDSPAIRALRESIARCAADADLVLLTGPQGAGHEAAARAIHHASSRGRQAFIHVNCAMLAPGQDPGTLTPPRASTDAARPRASRCWSWPPGARCISSRSIDSPSICRVGLPGCWRGSTRHVNAAGRPSPTSASSSIPRCRWRRRAASIRSCCRCSSAGS